jgi:hypothetical protein
MNRDDRILIVGAGPVGLTDGYLAAVDLSPSDQSMAHALAQLTRAGK